MIERLFVYSTLGPNRPNEHILADLGGSWQDATVVGTLKQQGWGAEMGYPGIVLSENAGQKVEGFVFASENLTNNWQMLDGFEGEGYERVITKAKLNDGDFVDTFIYVLK